MNSFSTDEEKFFDAIKHLRPEPKALDVAHLYSVEEFQSLWWSASVQSAWKEMIYSEKINSQKAKEIKAHSIVQLAPLALKALVDILRSDDHPAKSTVALKVLGNNFKYLEKYAEKLAEIEAQSGDEQVKGFELAYKRDDLE